MLATGTDTGWVAHAVGVATLAGSFNDPVKRRCAWILEHQFGRSRNRMRAELQVGPDRSGSPLAEGGIVWRTWAKGPLSWPERSGATPSASAWSPSPFQVVAAAESRDITLHRVHEKDGAER